MKMRSLVARLGRDRRGAVAVQFAAVAVPLMVVVTGAIDVSRASALKVNLQDALDSAALAAARSNADTEAELQPVGEKMMRANFSSPDAEIVASRFYPEGSRIIASAKAAYRPYFASIWRDGDTYVAASAEVSRSVNKIELALVLDNTGSMSGTKLSTLKTASKKLIDTLSEAAGRSAEPEPVKIALAPFSMTVRVGSAYKDAAWLDTAGAAPINDQIFSSHANRLTLFNQMNTPWAGCVESRQHPYDVQETAPSAADPATLFTPFFAPDEPDTSNAGYVNNYLADGVSGGWQGRQGNPAKYVKKPKSGTNGAGYAFGPNAGCALQPIRRLTTDFEGLKDDIDDMTAVGDTNIPMGLVWGWHLLSPGAPFSDGVPYGAPKTQKIVILMTDGDNTHTSSSNSNASIYAGAGYIWQGRLGITGGTTTQRRTAMDGRLATLCSNMKAKGIIIYTVRVEVSGGSSSVMRDCATTPDKFYDVQSVSQLTAVFDSIAAAIQNLRIIR